MIRKILTQSSLFTLTVVFTSSNVFAQSYDPKTDPAYAGYKYRPGQGFSASKFKLPPKPTCIKEVKSTINVSGTFDGKGCLYTFKGSAKGKSYKELCFAPQEISEGLPPMFKLNAGATLKNVQIECALDGIHTTRNNVIDNVIMRDVEEDAVTISEYVTVKNSQFWFCNDKCIQMNRAKHSSISNNKFYYSTSAVLAHTGYDIKVDGNFFYQAGKAIRSRKEASLVRASNNRHESGNCMLSAQEKGVLEDLGGNTVSGVSKKSCVETGGKVVVK